MAGTRVLLDTNVWSYLIDADAVEDVRKAAQRSRVDIVACPAVLYECLRLNDSRRRRALVKTLARQCWTRQMPEIFTASQRLRTAISRHRPDWLRQTPNLREWRANVTDWGGPRWRRASTDTKAEARRIAERGGAHLDLARVQSRERRQDFHDLSIDIHRLNLDEAWSWWEAPMPGWDGERFETWRLGALDRWWTDLVQTPRETVLEWTAPWLDLPLVSCDWAGWVRFWTKEVAAVEVPYEWLAWAMSAVQATRKVTPGTPVDNQITWYLTDADHFVTADKAFAQCILAIAPRAPVQLASASVSPAGKLAQNHLIGLIEELAPRAS